MKKRDSLGDRMKQNYEIRGRHYLTRRTPVVLRLDGKAFHTFTRGFERPFDKTLSDLMTDTAMYLAGRVQGTKLVYVQSDEISILITDFDKLTTTPWFDYETSKMNSIAASMAAAYFNVQLRERVEGMENKYPAFDCRAYNMPNEEIANYFRWRYQDWLRNSISMLAQSEYSQEQLDKKNQADMHEMLYEKDINWAHLDPLWKNGTLLYRQDGKFVKNTDIAWVKDPMFVDFVGDLMTPKVKEEKVVEQLEFSL
jgi:tRNA(His) 5'-end guanylyltransferase